MKRIMLLFLVVCSLFIIAASPVFAGGDQVRGEKGEGEINQVQIQDPPPFQP